MKVVLTIEFDSITELEELLDSKKMGEDIKTEIRLEEEQELVHSTAPLPTQEHRGEVETAVPPLVEEQTEAESKPESTPPPTLEKEPLKEADLKHLSDLPIKQRIDIIYALMGDDEEVSSKDIGLRLGKAGYFESNYNIGNILSTLQVADKITTTLGQRYTKKENHFEVIDDAIIKIKEVLDQGEVNKKRILSKAGLQRGGVWYQLLNEIIAEHPPKLPLPPEPPKPEPEKETKPEAEVEGETESGAEAEEGTPTPPEVAPHLKEKLLDPVDVRGYKFPGRQVVLGRVSCNPQGMWLGLDACRGCKNRIGITTVVYEGEEATVVLCDAK